MIATTITYAKEDYLFFLENMLIVAAYLTAMFVAIFMDKIVPVGARLLRPITRAVGASFFFMSAITHTSLAFHTVTQTPVINALSERHVDWSLIFAFGWQSVSLSVLLFFLARDTILCPRVDRND